MGRTSGRIVPLDKLDDYEISKGDPDPRGWDVKAANGNKVGEVDKLLVDVDAKQVRYLDVDLDDSDQHTLIPIGRARLDDDNDEVLLDSQPSKGLGALPPYDHGPVTRDYERQVLNSWVPETQWAGRQDQEFYNHACFDTNRFYGRRRA
ncbi:MAG TPA: PRC-barrel domain-containing protein [Gemmatimonadaceae bacterium]|nr:PRC-barrel domain-containing protein [Gemmatimonadaceae bacterium]